MQVFRKFISLEAAGGYGLFLAAIIALVWINSPFQASYEALTNLAFSIKINSFTGNMPLSFIVNEGLMTLFFFLVGLEVKRELVIGELSSLKKAILPAIAAVGGMVVPALIYIAFNWGNPIGLHGWAIPTATDIAFSLAILSLLGNRVPTSLKIFLTALAIFDDLGAILIIAVFYAEKIGWVGLGCAGFLEAILILLNIFEVALPILYAVLGILIWVLLSASGIHPTLTGVLVALTVPLKIQKNVKADLKSDASVRMVKSDRYIQPLSQMERTLHPWVTFLILPLFAFINSGISLDGFGSAVTTPVSLGIVFGLFIGKQLGVVSFCWLAIQSKFAELPKKMNWKNLYGIALLCGIGFTMSFFIGFLSFDNTYPGYQDYLRSGILLGSLLSAVFGYVWLRWVTKKSKVF